MKLYFQFSKTQKYLTLMACFSLIIKVYRLSELIFLPDTNCVEHEQN